ncbi:hypothetical protein [Herbidospora sp. NBRC 101105]|uniref:hypothetical protein n=1 Tax=Herbidospora sp. NBRC 101105 TaxID=3032195 RepID=UPI0024A4CC98|nr:hypothetical protein [Herbidospora sp. NBRC 101105]GLX94406.1 hypothetical protein Hesp01_23560 [Herbidospora sp. NBRC 101105]
MTAVILGLVAVVLLVLIVVALGMRSMNRRESALSSERIKAMAEGAAKKKGSRPAEETFFESFPEGFDAFEEPKKAPPKPAAKAPGAPPRPGSRQGAKQQPAGAPRGKRGVDEWGADDDYDDDYWSRVRADDGAFGGTIKQRMATPRPVEPEPAAAGPAPVASVTPISSVDPNAATVQGVLPQRPAAAQPPAQPAPTPGVVTPIAAVLTPGVVTPIAGLSTGPLNTGPLNTGTPSNGFLSPDTGMVDGLRATPSSQLAEQKTVTFSAPTPEPSGPATGPFSSGPSTGMFDRPGSYDQPPTGPFPSRPAYDGGYDTGYTSGNFPVPAAPQPEPIPPAYPEPTGWPAPPAGGAGYQPPAATPASWAGTSGDVFDDPEPPRPGSGSTWSTGEAAGYQMPAPSYNDFSTGAYQTGNLPTPAPGSYEVSAGWATIDDSDSVAGSYGYDQQGYPGAVPPAPPQNNGGSWPSYDELYGEQTTRSGGGRRGTHRGAPETDQPDYYR